MANEPENRTDPEFRPDDATVVNTEPVRTEPPLEAPAQPAADTATAQAPQQQPGVTSTAAPPRPQPQVPGSRFSGPRDNGSGTSKLAKATNQMRGQAQIDEAFLKRFILLDNAGADDKGNLKFKMTDGKMGRWHTISRPDGSSYEAISFTPYVFAKFEQHNADAFGALAKSYGWKSADVHGRDQKEKEMLWLGLNKAGVEVRNFTPEPGSAIWEKLKEASPQRFDQLQAASSPLGQFLAEKAATCEDGTEKKGFRKMHEALICGRAKFDEIEQRAVISAYKPRVDARTHAEVGDGYNRVVDTFAAKGVIGLAKKEEPAAAAPAAPTTTVAAAAPAAPTP